MGVTKKPSRTQPRKRCRACHRSKPLPQFTRLTSSPDGRHSWCRGCQRAYRRRWVAAHHDAYVERQREYRRRNRQWLRTYNREYQRRRRLLMRADIWNPNWRSRGPEIEALLRRIARQRRQRSSRGARPAGGTARVETP